MLSESRHPCLGVYCNRRRTKLFLKLRSSFFHGAPSGRMFQRVKVPNPPDSGKDIAKSKGVLGNWESEGSWRQITGLTNRNHEG